MAGTAASHRGSSVFRSAACSLQSPVLPMNSVFESAVHSSFPLTDVVTELVTVDVIVLVCVYVCVYKSFVDVAVVVSVVKSHAR